MRNLVLMANVGIHSFEKTGTQRIRLNVDLAVRETEQPPADEINQVVCYEEVTDGIKGIVGRGHVNLVAIGMVDNQTPRVEVHLAADAAGQESVLPAVLAVADDGMADRRHVHAQLVGTARHRLKFHPGGAVACAVDHAVAGARKLAVLFIDAHLLAARSGLLGKGQVDQAVTDIGHADHKRPVDLARGAAGKAL